MRLLNRFYNEDLLRRDVEETLDIVSIEEATAWLRHPCTKALKKAIEADMCGILNIWLGGGYADEKSTDITAQREGKARGMAQAMDDLLETIEEIGHKKLKGDDDGNTGSGAFNIG